jgi:hypothetical protein
MSQELFPAGVRVVLAEDPTKNVVLDLGTGDVIEGIKGIVLEFDANEPDKAQLILVVHPRKFEVEAVDGKYEVDERTLRRVAQQNGFKLVRMEEDSVDLPPLGTAAPEKLAPSPTAVGAPVTSRDKPAELIGEEDDEEEALVEEPEA